MGRIAFDAKNEVAVDGDAYSLMQILSRAALRERIDDPLSGRAIPKGFAPIRAQGGEQIYYANPQDVAYVTD